MGQEPTRSAFVLEHNGCYDGMITLIALKIYVDDENNLHGLCVQCYPSLSQHLAFPFVRIWYCRISATQGCVYLEVVEQTSCCSFPGNVPQTVVQVGDIDFGILFLVISSRLARNLDCYAQCQLMTRIPLTAHAATGKRLALTPDRSCTAP